MHKYKVQRKDTRLFVTVDVAKSVQLNELEINKMARNPMRGFLKPVVKTGWLGQKKLVYTGPIGISLSERLQRPCSPYEFFFLMVQIVEVTRKAKQYEFSVNKLLFDKRYIFINEATKELQFLYLPIDANAIAVDVIGFMESVIQGMGNSLGGNADYASQFHRFLQTLSRYDEDVIEKYIRKVEPSAVVSLQKQTGSGFLGKSKTADTELLDQGGSSSPTDVLGGGECTMLLGEFPTYPKLHRLQTNDQIEVNKPTFRIGKEHGQDYVVTNNNAISRSHAQIITRENRYYIVDLNSKNYTCVNGQRILPNQEVEIADGYKLKLSNEEFIFMTEDPAITAAAMAEQSCVHCGTSNPAENSFCTHCGRVLENLTTVL